MARHRNYRNYAYEDGTVNVPLIYYSTKYLDCYKKIMYELFKISTEALTYFFQNFLLIWFGIFKATVACMNRIIKSNGPKFFPEFYAVPAGGLVESFLTLVCLFSFVLSLIL